MQCWSPNLHNPTKQLPNWQYHVLSSLQNTNYAYQAIRIQLRMYMYIYVHIIHTSVNLSMWVDCHSDAHFYPKYSCCIDISITPIFAFNVLADDKSPHRKSSTNTEQEPVQSKKPSGPDSATIRSNVRKSLIEVLKERLVCRTLLLHKLVGLFKNNLDMFSLGINWFISVGAESQDPG